MKGNTDLRHKKYPVAVLGVTGIVGQRFIQLLDNHPWFQVTTIAASDNSIGYEYQDVCHWVLPNSMPEWVRRMKIQKVLPPINEIPLVFSALPTDVAGEVEPQYALRGAIICSNASAFRREPDVPVILPEVNPDHTAIVNIQRQLRSWKGFIVTNPNCTSTGMTVALKPLKDAFGLKKVTAVSLQAISGAGYPGVSSLDILNNVIPFIQGEEEKIEWEPRKILGELKGNQISLADFLISAHANRVPVTEGHTVCLEVEFSTPVDDIERISQALTTYTIPTISVNLPSTPKPILHLISNNDRPQPRLDTDYGGGMTTVIGRLRLDAHFRLKMVVLSHNTIRGAAGGSIYNAELLVKQGLLPNR